MQQFLKNPGLPAKPVKTVIASPENKEIIARLEGHYGISVLFTKPNNQIQNPISSHSDMLITHLGSEFIILENSQSHLKGELERRGMSPIVSETVLSKQYPSDIAFNIILINSTIIGLEKHMAPEIKKFAARQQLKIRDCKQGYSRCSCAFVSNGAIITGDATLLKIFKTMDFDVLKITNQGILLTGYDVGFIGGCCAKLEPSVLAVTGDIGCHKDCENIKAFCRNHNVYIESLCEGPLRDIGGIIPISY